MTMDLEVVVEVLSGWQQGLGCGRRFRITTSSNPYRGFRYPAEVIQHAVWLYHCFLPRDGFRQRLFDERFVCIRATRFAGNHANLDLAGYAALPHALFSSSGGDGAPAEMDAILVKRNLHRRMVVTLPHVMAVPFAVSDTDLVAAAAEHVAQLLSRLADIAVLPLPIKVPPFGVDLIYTKHSTAAEPVR